MTEIKYPLSNQDFEKIIKDKKVYVDKTALIYKLINKYDGRKIYLIGLNYSSQSRNVEDWKIELE